MGVRERLGSWPLLRQLGGDPFGLGAAVLSERSLVLRPRTAEADRVSRSVCPYYAVGCGQRVYVKDEQVTQIGAALVMAGAAVERLAVFGAGMESARDPRFTVAPQRRRLAGKSGPGGVGGPAASAPPATPAAGA